MTKRSHSKPQKEPKAVPSQKREPAQTNPANNLGPLVAAFLLTFLITRIPREVVNTGLDAAWGYVLNFAHQKHLQFGTDIVYTYGPLGFWNRNGSRDRARDCEYFSPSCAVSESPTAFVSLPGE
jgi:hypothetical protein